LACPVKTQKEVLRSIIHTETRPLSKEAFFDSQKYKNAVMSTTFLNFLGGKKIKGLQQEVL
jgi:hypothetical protein